MPRTDFPPPRKSWGQHFLTAPAVAAAIVAALPAVKGEQVLEIGPGRGALTNLLLTRGYRLTVVECDPKLVQYWRKQAGLECLAGDILQLGPELFADRGPLHLISNLPYNISSPLLALCSRHAASLLSLTIMLQHEFGARLLAPPGGKDYSALSVVAQCVWRWEKIIAVGRGCFKPPPKVDSIVLRGLPVNPCPEPAVLKKLEQVARAVFSARRKKLSNTLPHALGGDSERARALLALTGTSPDLRPERVAPEIFLAWARSLVADR